MERSDRKLAKLAIVPSIENDYLPGEQDNLPISEDCFPIHSSSFYKCVSKVCVVVQGCVMESRWKGGEAKLLKKHTIELLTE